MAEKVLGLGGVFLKAREPERLAAWYRDALGIDAQDFGGTIVAQFPLSDSDNGTATWSVFPADADYFPGPAMVNFRVRDLDAMLAQVRATGTDVADGVQEADFGRFGWVVDPEGNRIELWQPAPE